jgi:GNAT superfamily N-acetyltransferase
VHDPLPVARYRPADHDASGFDCGVHEISEWIRDRRHAAEWTDAVAVWVAVDGDIVVAFYSLQNGTLEYKKAPEELTEPQESRFPLPVTYLRAFAVSAQLQGRGYGRDLLLHALAIAARSAENMTSWAVTLHAYDEKAQGFYAKYGFELLDESKRLMCLKMADVRATLEKWGHLS